MHAITPSAGHPREPDCDAGTIADCEARFTGPNFGMHPVNAANRERSMRTLNLATVIACDVVSDVIANNAVSIKVDGYYWFDINRPALAEPDMGGFWTTEEIAECKQRIDRAVQYIELREPDAFPSRFIRHPDQPHLVRFEAKP
ncbi:hypothetical protein [Thermomonas sp.]|uniref:hypothetical protein n=1 Tax=Thermomonas sp. TaxID=1971895 RepID=UPI0035B4907C